MAIKIDLEKAYDILYQEFIRDTLVEVGLNEEWIRNIMRCMETYRMSLLWNGENIDYFKPNRGIWQGDVMSPYIFVLCIERLSYIIYREIFEGA